MPVLSGLYAQSTFTGTVVDAVTNQPIVGVTIATSTQHKTITDQKGNFILPGIGNNDSLLMSSIGYDAATVAAAAPGTLYFLSPSFASLNQVVVSGGREAQRRTEVPVAINLITKTTINDNKATRLDMLINKVPGVFMVDLGNEQHSMSVRQPLGYKSLFLYLQDGIPIRTTGDFNHNALIEINQASLERIEVIKGPASSLYGSEAVGGAINFITQSPTPFLSGKVQAEAGTRGYKRTDINISNSYKKLGIFLGGYYARQDQPEQEHNDFNKTAITLRADYAFSERLKLSTVAEFIKYKTDQKGGLDSAHFYGKDYSSFYRFTYRSVDAFRLRSSLKKEWNKSNTTNFTIFYRKSAIGQNPFYSISNIASDPLKAKGQLNEDAFKSFGSLLQHTVQLKPINAKLIAGISADYSPATYFARFISIDKNSEKVYYQFTEQDSLLTNYNVDLLNTAIYTQFEYKPTTRLKLVAAARYDRLDYQFDNHLAPGAYTGAPDHTDFFHHFTPKLGLTYDLRNNRGFYLNYSMGFAPPNITELYAGVQVPVLKASSYNNYEIGGWFGFASNKGSAEISIYHLDGENEIVSTRLADGTYQNQNAGKTRHQGVETNWRFAPVKSLQMRVGATYARHEYVHYVERGKDYSGMRMAQAPFMIYNAEIIYKPFFIKGFRIAMEMQGMNKYFTDPQNTASYDGFTVFNLRAGYKFQQFEVWANCLNLTNKLFANTVEKSAYGTSYRPGQLRTLHIGMAMQLQKSTKQ